MPWTLDRYPPAMQRLPPEVLVKAIEIANAMLAEGYEEGQAVRMAIAAAKKWAWGAYQRFPAGRRDANASPRRGAGSVNTRERGR